LFTLFTFFRKAPRGHPKGWGHPLKGTCKKGTALISAFQISHNLLDYFLHFRDTLLADHKHRFCIDIKIMMRYDVPHPFCLFPVNIRVVGENASPVLINWPLRDVGNFVNLLRGTGKIPVSGLDMRLTSICLLFLVCLVVWVNYSLRESK